MQSKIPGGNYGFSTEKLIEIFDKHALLKKRFMRRNYAKFMNKELKKVICSRLTNIFWKNPTKESKVNYKKQPKVYSCSK